MHNDIVATISIGGDKMSLKKYFNKNYAVLILICINIIVFIALNAFPDLRDVFLLNAEPKIALEKPWTLITVFFSHELLIHILLNMFLVLVFGTELYKETNAKVVYIAYILCGFIGSLSVLVYASLIGYNGGLIAGASAASFGIVATYVMLQPNAIILKSKSKYWLIALFVVNAILTIQNPQVSVGGPAHAIGILVGLLIGWLLKKKLSSKNNQ